MNILDMPRKKLLIYLDDYIDNYEWSSDQGESKITASNIQEFFEHKFNSKIDDSHAEEYAEKLNEIKSKLALEKSRTGDFFKDFRQRVEEAFYGHSS